MTTAPPVVAWRGEQDGERPLVVLLHGRVDAGVPTAPVRIFRLRRPTPPCDGHGHERSLGYEVTVPERRHDRRAPLDPCRQLVMRRAGLFR